MLPAFRIDAHVHWLPAPFVEALERRTAPPRLLRSRDGSAVDCGRGFAYPVLPGMTDLGEHERQLAQAGVTGALVGGTPPGVDELDPADAVAVARACNDELAALPELSARYFAGLAMLPLVRPEAAAAELKRAGAMGIRGAQVFSSVRGRSLDEEEFRVVLDTAAELDVAIVLHPTFPTETGSLSAYGLVTMVGFLFETTVCALRLVFSGLYERHPGFKLLVPHVGSLIPYILPRVDYESQLFGSAAHLAAPPSEYVRRFYVDSVCLWPPALRMALDVFGAERVLLGTDTPFWDIERGLDTVDALGLPEQQLESICSRNAERLFGPFRG
jgi:predicted TIM-barrel fold metal-dependent hydrolase